MLSELSSKSQRSAIDFSSTVHQLKRSHQPRFQITSISYPPPPRGARKESADFWSCFLWSIAYALVKFRSAHEVVDLAGLLELPDVQAVFNGQVDEEPGRNPMDTLAERAVFCLCWLRRGAPLGRGTPFGGGNPVDYGRIRTDTNVATQQEAMSNTILITGGCGFVGSNLAVFLADKGFQVLCFGNFSRHGSEHLAERVHCAGCKVERGDVRNPEDLARIPGADVLVECSAEPSVLVGSEGADARYLLNVNLVGALNGFEWARERHAGIVFLSTSRVYPIAYLRQAAFEQTSSRFVLKTPVPGVSAEGVTVNCSLDGVRSLYGASKLT